MDVKLAVSICAIAVLSKAIADDNVTCKPGWENVHRTCVQFVKEKPFKTWQVARDYCKNNGADLLVINDATLNNAMNEVLRRHVQRRELLYWWIGLKKQENMRTWKWVNGDDFFDALFNWNPNKGISDDVTQCAMLGKNDEVKTNLCDDKRPFICELAQVRPQFTLLPEKENNNTSNDASQVLEKGTSEAPSEIPVDLPGPGKFSAALAASRHVQVNNTTESPTTKEKSTKSLNKTKEKANSKTSKNESQVEGSGTSEVQSEIPTGQTGSEEISTLKTTSEHIDKKISSVSPTTKEKSTRLLNKTTVTHRINYTIAETTNQNTKTSSLTSIGFGIGTINIEKKQNQPVTSTGDIGKPRNTTAILASLTVTAKSTEIVLGSDNMTNITVSSASISPSTTNSGQTTKVSARSAITRSSSKLQETITTALTTDKTTSTSVSTRTTTETTLSTSKVETDAKKSSSPGDKRLTGSRATMVGTATQTTTKAHSATKSATTINKTPVDKSTFLGCFDVNTNAECPPVKAFGIQWTRTKPGDISIVTCANGQGHATWRCRQTPICWERKPDIESCASQDIKNLKQKINKLNQKKNDSRYVVNITAEMAHTANDDLSEHDALQSSELLKSVSAALSVPNSQNDSLKIIENMAIFGSRLIGKKGKKATTNKISREVQKTKASSVMSSMENVSLKMLKAFRNTTEKEIKSDNMG